MIAVDIVAGLVLSTVVLIEGVSVLVVTTTALRLPECPGSEPIIASLILKFRVFDAMVAKRVSLRLLGGEVIKK